MNKSELVSSLLFVEGLKKYLTKDKRSAFYLFEEASINGSAEANRYLGLMFEDGVLEISEPYPRWEIKKNHNKALEYFKKACELGDAQGCISLGLMYYEGKGTEQDHKKALTYYEKALELFQIGYELGYRDQSFEIGLTYFQGNRRSRDIFKASEYFKRACDDGETRGCNFYKHCLKLMGE